MCEHWPCEATAHLERAFRNFPARVELEHAAGERLGDHREARRQLGSFLLQRRGRLGLCRHRHAAKGQLEHCVRPPHGLGQRVQQRKAPGGGAGGGHEARDGDAVHARNRVRLARARDDGAGLHPRK